MLILQSIVLFLLVSGSLCPAGSLKTGKRSPTGFWVEGVHYDGFGAFNLTAAKRAALTLRLLKQRQEEQTLSDHSSCIEDAPGLQMLHLKKVVILVCEFTYKWTLACWKEMYKK